MVDDQMPGRKLPKDPNKPFIVNGIKFANREEYNKRVKEDAEAMAVFLLNQYRKHKQKQSKV